MNANHTSELHVMDTAKRSSAAMHAFGAVADVLQGLPMRLPSLQELREVERDLQSEPAHFSDADCQRPEWRPYRRLANLRRS